ncbi:MAG: DUF2851 family protein [Bacteroidota bacterium]
MKLQNFPEIIIQKAVHKLLSDPSVIRATSKGNRLQVLSPGRINVNAGPDFIDTAILLDGAVRVGNSEFHRKSSEWIQHEHHKDIAYDSVILHIVFEDNLKESYDYQVLVLNEEDVFKDFNPDAFSKNPTDVLSIDEIQHFALIRLLRKSADVQKILFSNDLLNSVKIYTKVFLERYLSKTRRPVYSGSKLSELLDNIGNSHLFSYLEDIKAQNEIKIHTLMNSFIRKRIFNEGEHLRREIILNCILPISICLANEQNRIDLFHWYWSTPSIVKYGILSRRFKELPQNYLWQQQGMLEFLYEYGSKRNVISELIREYGFAEILSFYRYGSI